MLQYKAAGQAAMRGRQSTRHAAPARSAGSDTHTKEEKSGAGRDDARSAWSRLEGGIGAEAEAEEEVGGRSKPRWSEESRVCNRGGRVFSPDAGPLS